MNKLFLFALTLFLFSFNGLSADAQNVKKPSDANTRKVEDLSKLLSAEEKEVLEKAVRLEVLEIGETVTKVGLDEAENQKLNEKNRFHGFKTIKTVSVSESADVKNLITDLFSVVGKGTKKRCFIPRHGIRATYENKTIELLICFECGVIYSYNGKESKSESIDYPLQASLNKTLAKTEK